MNSNETVPNHVPVQWALVLARAEELVKVVRLASCSARGFVRDGHESLTWPEGFSMPCDHPGAVCTWVSP